MLCQFTVKNYKSIRDEVTFDMQAAAISEQEDKIIKSIWRNLKQWTGNGKGGRRTWC